MKELQNPKESSRLVREWRQLKSSGEEWKSERGRNSTRVREYAKKIVDEDQAGEKMRRTDRQTDLITGVEANSLCSAKLLLNVIKTTWDDNMQTTMHCQTLEKFKKHRALDPSMILFPFRSAL